LKWLETELKVGLRSFLTDSGNKGNLKTIDFRFEYLKDFPFRVGEGEGFIFDFSWHHMTDWNADPPVVN
jgi:hypothetical protein